MTSEYRQSAAFQEMFRDDGGTVIDVGAGQVGYLMRPPWLPFFSVLVVPRVTDPCALAPADCWARRYRAMVTMVAPSVLVGTEEAARWQTALAQHGFKPSTFGPAPTKTSVIDLRFDDELLLKRMGERTRYSVKVSRRRGVTATVLDGQAMMADPAHVDAFYGVYEENCRRVKIHADTRRSVEQVFRFFGKNSFAVLTRGQDGTVAAGATFVVASDTIWYQLNGSTEQGRKDSATALVVWEGMLEGKRRGCSWLDFDGVYDDRYPKAQEAWKGFSQFKAGFGGAEVAYLPAHARWVPFLRRRAAAVPSLAPR